MPENWSSKRLRVYAVIGGTVFPDVIQFSATFELNAIPTATLVLPVGRETQTLLPSSVHTGGADFANRQKFPKLAYAEVYLVSLPLGDSGTVVDPLVGGTLLFAGYVVGMGWVRSTTAVGLTVQLVHWLAVLDFSSTLSADSHPSNPFEFTFSAIGGTGTAAGGSTQPITAATWLHGRDGKGQSRAAEIQADLWKVLQDMLLRIASQNTIEARGVLGQNVSGTETPPEQGKVSKEEAEAAKGNAEAKAALSRMFGRNMGLAMGSADATMVANSIANWLNAATLDNNQPQPEATLASFAHRTFWSKIIEVYAPNFQFQIVPRIFDCLVTPNVGGLRQVWRTIAANEYNTVDMRCTIQRVLGAVVLAYPGYINAGGMLLPPNGEQSVPPLNILSPIIYPNPPRAGIRLYRTPPAWLDSSYNYGLAAPDTTGSSGKPTTTAFRRRRTGEPSPAEDKARLTAESQKTMMQRYCHQLYVQEALKHRYGELTGRLRLDIAPGSNIRIEGMGERVAAGTGYQDQLATNIYAKVSRVTILIDAQAQMAGTAFAFTHLRTEAENNDEALSVMVPPLYSAAWVGDALYPLPEKPKKNAEQSPEQA